MEEDGYIAHVRENGNGGGSDEPPHGLADHLPTLVK